MDKYLQEAIAEYERNIESGQSFYMDASTLMDIEEEYEKQNRPYDAERLMRFAEKLHPDSDDVLTVKAYRLKDRGRWSEALAAISDVADRQGRDVQLFFIEWDVAEGRIDEAEKRLADNLPPSMQGEDFDWYLDMAEIYLDYGYVRRALHYLKQIPKDYSLRHRVDELEGDAHYQQQDYAESAEAFNRLIDADPYDSFSWAQLADVQQKAGKLEDCLTSCDYALAIDDDNQRAMSLKLYATFGLGRFEEGMQLFDTFESLMPDDYSIRMYAGEQLEQHDQPARAVIPLQEALRLCPADGPDRPRIVTALARTEARLGHVALSVEIMSTLTLTGTSLTDIYIEHADTLLTLGYVKEGCNLLEQAQARPEAEEKDIFAIMRLLIRTKTFAPARRLWEEMSHTDFTEEFTPLYAYLAYAAHQLREGTMFIRMFRKAVAQCPNALRETMDGLLPGDDTSTYLPWAFREVEKWESGQS